MLCSTMSLPNGSMVLDVQHPHALDFASQALSLSMVLSML